MNSEYRKKRNENIIEDAKKGIAIKAIMEKYKLSYCHILNLTRGVRKKKKNELVIDRVKEKGIEGIREWAEENNISLSVLSYALKKIGYKLPRKYNKVHRGRYLKMSKVYPVIAALQNGATPNYEEAKRLGVTRQYISQVRLLCESAGVKIK